MDLDMDWTIPVDINEEADTRVNVNEPYNRNESMNLYSVNSQSTESSDYGRLSRNRYVVTYFLDTLVHCFRLRIKFDKYFNAMNDELIQAIYGHNSDQPTRKIIKSDHLKRVSNELILMVLYCLQPRVRSKISVFNLNKDKALSEVILRSICICKISFHFVLN